MKIYESVSTATWFYPKELTTTELHNGHRYELMGKSFGKTLTFSERVRHVMAIVGIVVAAVFTFGIIFTGMASPTFRDMIIKPFKEVGTGAQINLHYILQKPKQWQIDKIQSFLEKLKFFLNFHVPSKLTSASCCISVQYNHAESNADEISLEDRSKVKKQLIFKEKHDSPFSNYELIQDIENIKNDLQASIIKEIDVATTWLNYGCLILYQETPLDLVKMSYFSIDSTTIDCNENALKFVGVNREEVLSQDRKKILVGPNCEFYER